MLLLAALARAGLALATPAVPPPIVPPPTIPPATLDDTLEITGEDLDARQVRSRMFVGVTIGTAGPFRFLVDSGADRSVVGRALADRLALPAEDVVRLQGMAGTADVGTVRLAGLRVGRSNIPSIVAPALPEHFIGAQGLLGIDALVDQRLRFDYDTRTVTIEDSRRREALTGDEIVVTARRRRGQLILTQAGVDGINLFAVIDSGSEMTMGNRALEARLFGRRGAPHPQPIVLTSVTGQTLTAMLAVLPELTIGRITLRDVPVAFADAAPFALFGLADQPALLLGSDVLQTFRRVSLDFRARRVRFTLRH